jgi:hypothetical protein
MQTPQQQLVAHVARLFPEAVFYKETSEKVVALTIDDVPTPNEANDESNQLILDAIATHNQTVEFPHQRVLATFFVISSQLRNGSDILDRIVAAGHEVGNHGAEDITTALLRPEIFAEQLSDADRFLLLKMQITLLVPRSLLTVDCSGTITNNKPDPPFFLQRRRRINVNLSSQTNDRRRTKTRSRSRSQGALAKMGIVS